MLRQARATKQVEASSPRTAAINEPALFPRPAEKEKLQRADGPGGPWVGRFVIDEATDSETTLAMRPAPVAEESTQRKSEPTPDIFRSGKLEHAQAQPVIKQLLRASKTLPEIKDPLPVVVPEFHPGSVFVARITSSRKNLEALILIVLLVFAGIAAFLIPQLRKSLADGREDAVTKTTNLPTESSDPIAGSGTNVSDRVETPSAATTESTTAPPSKDFEETTTDTQSVESTSRFESAEVSEKGSAGIATTTGSKSRAHPWSGNRIPEPSENKREFSPATSMSHSAAPARKQREVSRPVKFKPKTVAEEQAKPAPLSGEMSRSHIVHSTPARSANEVSGSHPAPLSIISGKPKSKVIQWP